MSGARIARARSARALLVAAAALTVSSCGNEEEAVTNAAAKPVELARYLPEDTAMVQTVDVAKAREELDLTEDANAAPTTDGFLARRNSPEVKLFQVTSNAFPIVSEAFSAEFHARGASPLDGTLIRAAATGQSRESGRVIIVSTAEPSGDISAKLELTGYSLESRVYVAGSKTPDTASPVVADAGSGRIVFADEAQSAKQVLRRLANEAEPGPAAEALEPANGSVRLAFADTPRGSCVTAFAAGKTATDEGAALALTISGEKPDPNRFDPKAFRGLDFGTSTVLVDALIVPFSVKKPLRDGIDPIVQVVTAGGKVEVKKVGRDVRELSRLVPPPVKAYDCP